MTTKKNLQQLKVIVYEILKTDERTRNSDSLLYLRVLDRIAKDTDSLVTPFSMTVAYFLQNMQEHGFPPFESVRRARQKAQAECPELKACERVQAMRKENEAEYFEFAAQKEPDRRSKPVRCLETGQIFPSAEAAARAFGAATSSVCSVCNGRLKHCRGLHFEYLENYDGKGVTLCWNCANAYGGCSWTARDEHGVLQFKPVPGWDAKPTTVAVGAGKREPSFCVKSCPEFIPDRRMEKSGASG